jgi:hypothetical protein
MCIERAKLYRLVIGQIRRPLAASSASRGDQAHWLRLDYRGAPASIHARTASIRASHKGGATRGMRSVSGAMSDC